MFYLFIDLLRINRKGISFEKLGVNFVSEWDLKRQEIHRCKICNVGLKLFLCCDSVFGFKGTVLETRNENQMKRFRLVQTTNYSRLFCRVSSIRTEHEVGPDMLFL